MIVRQCLRSGLCCRKGLCGYGEYDHTNKKCTSLIEHDDGTTSCGMYDVISQDPTAKISPAFGYGCCMPIGNTERERIKNVNYNGVEQFIEIEDY